MVFFYVKSATIPWLTCLAHFPWPLISDIFQHDNSMWEQNKYHIWNQQWKLHRFRYISQKIFFRQKLTGIPLSPFPHKTLPGVPYRSILMEKKISWNIYEPMEFSPLIPNMIFVLLSHWVIMLKSIRYKCRFDHFTWFSMILAHFLPIVVHIRKS